jgi:hypothetical protein
MYIFQGMAADIAVIPGFAYGNTKSGNALFSGEQ